MKEHGFTLIELLAVIVILAIVSLIAVPIILGIVNKSKNSSAKSSIVGYIEAVEESVLLYNLDNQKGIFVPEDNDLTSNNEDDIIELAKLNIKGDKPSYITMQFENKKVKTAGFCINGFNVEYNDGEITDSKADYCDFLTIKELVIKNQVSFLVTGENSKLDVQVTTYSGIEITPIFKSTDENVATIDENGLITAVAPGTTKIVIIAGVKFESFDLVVNNNNSILGIIDLTNYENDTLDTIDVTVDNEIVSYNIHVYSFDGDQTWNESMIFGDDNDVGTETEYAKNMIVVKVNGNLTIGEDAVIEPYSTIYGGPKGFVLYVKGNLINNGQIDNSHGAYAEGENVYLWNNLDESFEYIPATGSTGGASLKRTADGCTLGATGKDGSSRSTGGGGSGSSCRWSTATVYSGAGAVGTSYSGGSGGGGASARSGTRTAGSGAINGQAGGDAITYRTNSTTYQAGGGAGNPGGTGSQNNSVIEVFNGANGTGGLLVIRAKKIENNGQITAQGALGGGTNKHASGGSSGGGSINIFSNEYVENGTVSADGGKASTGSGGTHGGAGGAGSVTIGSVTTGTFVAA